ncbi:MAG: hypothetical protein AABZ61_08515, partial [Bacteroidota bacterium]
LNYKKPDQQAISTMTTETASRYLSEGHFAEGSMKPKIEVAIEFIRAGGQEVVITNPELLFDAAEGKAGTHIIL